jgi:peptidoglycan hydrolase CwlO-like protein
MRVRLVLCAATMVTLVGGCDASIPSQPEITASAANLQVGITAAAANVQAGPHDICHGVLNQITERGFADPHLLAAAAEKNATILRELQSERSRLEALLPALEAQLAALNAQISSFRDAIEGFEENIAVLEALAESPEIPEGARLAFRDAAREIREHVDDLEAELADLIAQRVETAEQIGQLPSQIAEIDARIARAGC